MVRSDRLSFRGARTGLGFPEIGVTNGEVGYPTWADASPESILTSGGYGAQAAQADFGGASRNDSRAKQRHEHEPMAG